MPKSVKAYDFSAVAPSGQTLFYNITSNGVEITCKNTNYYAGDKPAGNLIIPDSVTNGGITYVVTSIGNYAFVACDGLLSVSIPNTVSSIGGAAFMGCGLVCTNYNGSITQWCNINFTDGSSNPILYSGNLFINNIEITDLIIPEGITEIKQYTFYGWRGLNSVTFPNSVSIIGKKAFALCDGLETLIIPGVTSIRETAFRDCNGLITVILPNSIDSIGNYAFDHCKRLSSVTIPSTVAYIGAGAFAYCLRLSSVTIPSTVAYIGGNAFNLVRHIEYYGSNSDAPWGALSMNGTVEGDFAYADTTKTYLTAYLGISDTVIIPSTVDTIGYRAFYLSDDIKYVYIPNNVKHIAQSSFCGCDSLVSVTLGNRIKSIDESAFFLCHNLSNTIYLGTIADWCDIVFSSSSSNPVSLSHNLFLNDTLVTTLVIPDTITTIKQYCFISCNSLSSIYLGSGITTIETYAFRECNNLSEIRIESAVAPSLGAYAFSYNDTIPVYIPCGSMASYLSAWGYFSNYIEPEGYNIYMITVDSSMGHAYLLKETTCDDATAIIYAETNEGYHFLQWSNGSTNNPDTLTLTSDTTITAIFVPDVTPQICMVSVQDNHNVVMWNKENDGVIATYNIYREGSITGEYEMVWSQPFDSMSVWIDTASRPSSRSYRYRMTSTDIYGYESAPSEVHKTMHLSINQGMGNQWNLMWTEYEGADFVSYMIYRGNYWNGLELIDQMPVGGNTTYTDENVPYGTVFYQVVAIKSSPCNITKSESMIRSNIATNDEVGIADVYTDNVNVYVRDGQIVVEGSEGETVRVYDMLGREVSHSSVSVPADSSHNLGEQRRIAVPTTGVYMVRVGNLPVRRVVVTR